MSTLDPDTLARLAPLRRQLRDLKGLTEARPGVFTFRGATIIALVAAEGGPRAEMYNASTGSAATQRFALDAPAGQRQLVDEARRRVVRLAED